MFADHINVLITDSDVGALQNKVDRVIVELKSLFQRNDLKINVHKTVVISLHSRQKKKGSSSTSSYLQHNESLL